MRSILLFAALFLVAFAALRHARPFGILFYQGVGLAALVSLAFVILFRARADVLKDALLLFLLLYVFVFTIPTTVDRAYSVRMLLRVDEAPKGLTRDEIARIYVDGFTAEGGVERRLSEQETTGTLVERDGRYKTTAFGSVLAWAFRVAQDAFSARQNR